VLTTILDIIGCSLIVAGVAVGVGVPAALIVAGVAVLAASILRALGGKP
jgi:hypothetical protein